MNKENKRPNILLNKFNNDIAGTCTILYAPGTTSINIIKPKKINKLYFSILYSAE